MPTTTNYGWTTPADTDLVKDGASAIRTLGSGVDTTVKNLNPETTLGDISYRSSTANTNTRLAIGTTGQVLTVSGGVPTWATPSSGGMTSLASGNLSGASVTISSISASYKDLQLIIRNFKPATDGAFIKARLNGDTGTSYYSSGTYGSPITDASFNLDFFSVTPTSDNTAANGISVCEFPDYSNTTTLKLHRAHTLTYNSTNSSNINVSYNNAIFNSTAAISSITLFPDTGNFTSGTYILYGVA